MTMLPIRMEEVFKRQGVPTYTFVEPIEYERLKISLRATGRGVVVEGPSGIGKTTAILSALSELDMSDDVLQLSARKQGDVELISSLPDTKAAGVVVIDDFHRLPKSAQQRLADHLKTLADEEVEDTKLVIVGINKVGDTLVNIAPDLNSRIDTIKFEVNPSERVDHLIRKGEEILNVRLNIRDEIVSSAAGSFYIAQLLCFETCIAASISQSQDIKRNPKVSFPAVVFRAMQNLARPFHSLAIRFATGPKLRPQGRAPYLYFLRWLAESNDWSICLLREVGKHPKQRSSALKVIEKRLIDDFFSRNPDFGEILHYNPDTTYLTVENPQFVFYLRNLAWNEFAQKVGFHNVRFEHKYDFALSFAGEEREIASRLFELLTEQEIAVFYDRNEQSRILATNVEDYLGPLYESESRFVICLLSTNYPRKIWTKFESRQFSERLGHDAVIPIWFTTALPSAFDATANIGGITFDPVGDRETQIKEIVNLLIEKLGDSSLDL